MIEICGIGPSFYYSYTLTGCTDRKPRPITLNHPTYLSVPSPTFLTWPQNDAGAPSSYWYALNAGRLAQSEPFSTACLILKPLTLRSMRWVGVVWVLMGLILRFDAESVNGLGSATNWRRNERIRDARATKPSCWEHPRLFWCLRLGCKVHLSLWWVRVLEVYLGLFVSHSP